MIDPTEIATGAELWLKYRPWLRMRIAIRTVRNRRRARLGLPILPIPNLEDKTMNQDQISSIGRTALKFAGGALVAMAVKHGLVGASDVDALTVAVEALGGAAITIVSMIWSHRTHA